MTQQQGALVSWMLHGIVPAPGDNATVETSEGIRPPAKSSSPRFDTKPVDLNDLEVTIDKTLEAIAYVQRLDRQRLAAERARGNRSRYFSPQLVELLAERDQPLGPVRSETVAVVFVDIVGFTRMAETMAPEEVVTLLREFHERMASEIRGHECRGRRGFRRDLLSRQALLTVAVLLARSATPCCSRQ